MVIQEMERTYILSQPAYVRQRDALRVGLGFSDASWDYLKKVDIDKMRKALREDFGDPRLFRYHDSYHGLDTAIGPESIDELFSAKAKSKKKGVFTIEKEDVGLSIDDSLIKQGSLDGQLEGMQTLLKNYAIINKAYHEARDKKKEYEKDGKHHLADEAAELSLRLRKQRRKYKMRVRNVFENNEYSHTVLTVKYKGAVDSMQRNLEYQFRLDSHSQAMRIIRHLHLGLSRGKKVKDSEVYVGMDVKLDGITTDKMKFEINTLPQHADGVGLFGAQTLEIEAEEDETQATAISNLIVLAADRYFIPRPSATIKDEKGGLILSRGYIHCQEHAEDAYDGRAWRWWLNMRSLIEAIGENKDAFKMLKIR